MWLSHTRHHRFVLFKSYLALYLYIVADRERALDFFSRESKASSPDGLDVPPAVRTSPHCLISSTSHCENAIYISYLGMC